MIITSVYLSNNMVSVLVGDAGKKFKVKDAYFLELKSECMINGVITNESDFIREMSDFWENEDLPRKNVTLVISSSQFALKTLNVPTVNESKTLEIINREYSDADRADNPVYDYYEMSRNSSDHTSSLLAVMAPGSYLSEFEDVFGRMDISLSSIVPLQVSAVKLFSSLGSLKKETCLIMLLDGTMLTGLLWVDGKYAYSQGTRLINEPGSEAFVNDIINNVNSMNQFSVSQRTASDVTGVYICGVSAPVFNSCAVAIEAIGLKLKKLPPSDAGAGKSGVDMSLADMVNNLGSLLVRKLDVNLYEANKKLMKTSPRSTDFKKFIVPIGATVAGIILIIGGMMLTNMILNNKLERRTAYLMDPVNVKAAKDAAAVVKENEALEIKIMDVISALETLESYPRMNSTVLKQIDDCGEGKVSMKLTGYDAASGQLTFLAKAYEPQEINYYINRLKATELFDKVEYTGYTYTSGEDSYKINVACYLNEQAGWESGEE